MEDKRLEARMLCSELVDVDWRDKGEMVQTTVMNLEDISLSGACVHCELEIPLGARLTIRYGNGTLPGVVRYCVRAEGGYFLGVEFSGGCKWPSNAFRPKHLLDPRTLVGRVVRREPETIH